MFSLFHAEALKSIQKGKSIASYFFDGTDDVFCLFVCLFVFDNVYHWLPSVLIA